MHEKLVLDLSQNHTAIPPGRVVIRLSQKAIFPMKKVRFGRFELVFFSRSLPAVIFG
jgi:hypothetical protein